MIKRLKNLSCEERLKDLDFFSPCRRLKGVEGGIPLHSLPVLKRWLQREQRLSLHKEPHREDKGQCVQVASGEILF